MAVNFFCECWYLQSCTIMFYFRIKNKSMTENCKFNFNITLNFCCNFLRVRYIIAYVSHCVLCQHLHLFLNSIQNSSLSLHFIAPKDILTRQRGTKFANVKCHFTTNKEICILYNYRMILYLKNRRR